MKHLISMSMLLAALFATVAAAVDVSGTWKAQMQMQGRNGSGRAREVTFTFKADGGNLTGTMSGFRGNQIDISDGKINGDEISFAVKREFNGNTMKLLYHGKVSGDEIKFTVEREGGQGGREFTAKRAS